MVYGVRPEHVRLSDAAGYRGEIVAAEYLGTTQIVTLKTSHGEVKARIGSARPARWAKVSGSNSTAQPSRFSTIRPGTRCVRT